MVEHSADGTAAKVNEVQVKASAFPVESVSLYSVGGRAEIKRNVTVQLKEGQNEVKILDMSAYLIEDSISVAGSGEAHAVIHSATVSQRSYSPPTTSDRLQELKAEEKALVDLVEIKKSAYNGLVKYAESLSTEHVKSSTLADDLATIETQMQERAKAKRDLDEKIRLIAKDIAEERDRLAGDEQPNLLSNILRVAVAAGSDGEVTLELKYAVNGTSWRPSYVLRVSTETNKVKLGYKAIIQQETGEAWNNIALTLETSQPTQGVELPVLYPQRLSFFKPLAQTSYAFASPAPRSSSMMPMAAAAFGGAPAPPPPAAPVAFARAKMAVSHAEASVQSTGASTSFTVPGRPSIPPNGIERNVTIAELDLDVVLSRAAVPKRSTLCHLRAQVRNTSQYILLAGPANVTLDGAFVAKTHISTVHPSETFTCALGADASIRITTSSPRSHASTDSSFFGVSTTSKTISRRIDVKNVANAARTVIVFDQVPIAEANKIAVDCLTPALGTPPSLSSTKEKEKEGTSGVEVVRVSKTVKARWAYVHEGSQLENEGQEAGEEGEKQVTKGKKEVNTEGRVRWEVELPAGESTAIEVAYKVTWPADERLVGL